MENSYQPSPYFNPAMIKIEPPQQPMMMPHMYQQPQPSVSTTPTKVKKKKVKQEKITDAFPVKKKRKFDRFQGMPEEEVMKRTLPDHLDYDLDIAIIGINPGLFAAFKGHHYAGPGNHFWKCLYLSGLVPNPMTCMDDYRLKEFGIGFTNIVTRTTRGSADLTRKEIKEGGKELLEKMKKYKPKIACFNGKGIYEIFSGRKDFEIGRQPEPMEGTDTVIFVMPSSSARCSQFPRATDKVPFYLQLKKLRNELTGRPQSPDPPMPPISSATPTNSATAADLTVKLENQMVDAANAEKQGFMATAQATIPIKQEPVDPTTGTVMSNNMGAAMPNNMGFRIKQEPCDNQYVYNAPIDFHPGSFIDSIPNIQNDGGVSAQHQQQHRPGVPPSSTHQNPNGQAVQMGLQLPNFSEAFSVKQEDGQGNQSCHFNA
ncbi:uncharacterized protein LOC144436353 [Glandiceps talaboti]